MKDRHGFIQILVIQKLDVGFQKVLKAIVALDNDCDFVPEVPNAGIRDNQS